MNVKHANDADYQKVVHEAWKKFISSSDEEDQDTDYAAVRPEVLASWKRSRRAGVNPQRIVTAILSEEEILTRLDASARLISIVRPYIQQIYSIVKGTGAYLNVSDRDGYILEVIGDDDIEYRGRTRSKLMRGACRQELVAGTNAIGTALALNRPIQLWGEEHYCEWNKPFACASAPFYDENGTLLGVINIALLKEYAHPHTLGMALCAADGITREFKLNAALNNLEQLSRQRNLIIENMTAGVFLLSSEGNIFQTNTIAMSMLGLSSTDVIGCNIYDLITIENVTNLSKFKEYISTEHYNTEATVSTHTRNNPQRRFNISINHIKDAGGQITAVLLRINRPEVIQKLVKRIEGYHAKYVLSDIIGNSEVMRRMKAECERVARNESNVLILGASGTGKELIAQSIHNASSVANGPFVAINCAALPNNLVESELFGYERGSFTGASKEGRPGKFELADGGTIFLDEIGDMPLDVQATLLRVIQTKEVIRIGGNSPKQVNIRIIAATNQDLLKAVEEKNFREDLYYRLNVFTIYAPLLKERGAGDIKLLADYFVQNYNATKGRNIHIENDVYPFLQNYDWPGNVRQLENVMERAINLADNDVITTELLPQHLLLYDGEGAEPSRSSFITEIPHISGLAAAAHSSSESKLPKATDSERALIESALALTKGRVTEAAAILDMNRRTLYRRLDRFGIDPNQYRQK